MADRISVIGPHLIADFNKPLWDSEFTPLVATRGKVEHVAWELFQFTGPSTYTYLNNGTTTLLNYSTANANDLRDQANRIYPSVASNENWTWLESTGGRDPLLTDLANLINTENFYGANFNIEEIASNIANNSGILAGPRRDGLLTIPAELKAKTNPNISLTFDMHIVHDHTDGDFYVADYGKTGNLTFNHTDLVNAGWCTLYAQCYDQWFDYGTINEQGTFVGHTSINQIISHVNRVTAEPGVTLENVGIILPGYAVATRKGSYGGFITKGGRNGQNLRLDEIQTGDYSALYNQALLNPRQNDQRVAEEDAVERPMVVESITDNGGNTTFTMDADYHTGGAVIDRILYNKRIKITGSVNYDGEHFPDSTISLVGGKTTFTTGTPFVATENNLNATFVNVLFFADDFTIDTWRTQLEAIGVKYFRTWYGGTGFFDTSTDTEPQDLTNFNNGKSINSTLVTGNCIPRLVSYVKHKQINQTSHGFNCFNVVRYNGAGYVLAQANNTTNNGSLVVSSVLSPDEFSYYTENRVYYVPDHQLGLAGTLLYLSDTTPGGLSTIPPSGVNTVVNPVLQVVDENNIIATLNTNYIVN